MAQTTYQPLLFNMAIDRKGLTLLAKCLGRAYKSITNLFGDTTLNPASILEMETLLCRLRGSTDFHNYDEMFN